MTAPGPQQPDEVVHACPEGDSGWTPCCDRTPFELPRTDRMTLDPALVTCRPAAPPAQPDEVPCACITPLPAGSLFYAGSHHQPGCVFYHAPAPAQPVRDTEEGRR